MHIDVIGFLAPTERSLRPQLLLKVVPAQIKLDNRRAIFDRGADKGVLVYVLEHMFFHSPLLAICESGAGKNEITFAQVHISVTTDSNCICTVTAILPPSPPTDGPLDTLQRG